MNKIYFFIKKNLSLKIITSPIFIAIFSGLLLTIYFTFPFILKLNNFQSDLGDYAVTGWTLLNGFNKNLANQYYPFSYVNYHQLNSLIPNLFIFQPILFLTKNYILSFNLTVFLSIWLTYIFAYLVYFQFSKNRFASILAAVIFSFSPLVMIRFYSHSGLLYRFFIPPLFLFFYLFLKEPRLKWAILFYLFFTLNALTASYFLISSMLLVSIIFLGWLVRLQSIKKIIDFLKKFVVLNLIGLVFLPIMIFYYRPYLEFSAHEGAERNIYENATFSAEPSDFFLGHPGNQFIGQLYRHGEINYAEHVLFTGFLAVVILLVSFVPLGLSKKRNQLVSLSFLLLFVSFILSLGPFLKIESVLNINIKLPYYYLHQYIYAFKSMRVPSRIMLTSIFFAGLIVSIFLTQVFQTFKRNQKTILFIFLLVFLLFEYKNQYLFPDYKKPILPEFLTNKKLIFFPDMVVASRYADNAKYLNLAIFNNLTIANGYSGYFSEDYLVTMKFLNEKRFENGWINYLKGLDLDYAVFDKKFYREVFKTEIENELTERFRLTVVYDDQNWLVLDLNKVNKDLCYIDRDLSKIKSELVVRKIYYIGSELNLGFDLMNDSPCIMRFFYEKRYLKARLSLEDSLGRKLIKKDFYLPVKPVLLPYEKAFIVKTFSDRLNFSPGQYIINVKLENNQFSRKISIN